MKEIQNQNNQSMKLIFSIILVILVIIYFCYSQKSNRIVEGFYQNKINENTNNQQKNKKKIAFCFLIYDKINNEKIWYDWLKNVDKNKYTIYIHYKENKPLDYFESYKLKKIIDTCWCCLSIVQAQNLILKEALKDNQNLHFIWLSQSCIPLKTFDYIYNYLNENKSYFNIAPDSQLSLKIKTKLKFIKNHDIKKAAMPSILNRKHSLKLVKNKDKIDWFKDIEICKEEITFITLLHHLGYKDELELTPNLSADAIIFTAWPDMSNYRRFENSILTKNQPNNYKYICPEELDYLINSKSLFGRKFEEKCSGLEELNNHF